MAEARTHWAQGYVAQLRADLANILRDENQKPTPWTARDFMGPRGRRRGSGREAVERFVAGYPEQQRGK